MKAWPRGSAVTSVKRNHRHFFFPFMQRFNELPCHFHKFHFKVNEFKYARLCPNIPGEPSKQRAFSHPTQPPIPPPPFEHDLEDVSVTHCNPATRRMATWENLLLPKSFAYTIWYKHKNLRDILSMQLDCLTAGGPPELSGGLRCAKCRVSQPRIHFPLSLNIRLPCSVSAAFHPSEIPLVSPPPPPPSLTPSLQPPASPISHPCVFLHCALPLFLLPPVSSSHGQRCLGHAAGRCYAL